MQASVLIVEDEPIFVEKVKDFLESRAVSCVSAENGHEALSFMRLYKPDAILLDLQLPGSPNFTGIHVLKAAHELNPLMKVLVVTGLQGDEIEQECMRLGAVEVIHKPINLPTLASALTKLGVMPA